MIWWLFGHLWWGLPSVLVAGGLAAFAFGVWPLVLATLSRIPPRAQILLLVLGAALIASSGLYAIGLEHGQERCQQAQATAQAKAIDKGQKAAQKAQEAATAVKIDVRQESENAAAEVREVVRGLPRTCPPVPDRVRDLGRDAVEAARASLPAGKDG